ncbi:MAG: transposase [Cyclobacteriaceae bacterium]
MSEKYKVSDQDRLYFITFAVVHWVDVFSRQLYRDIIVDSIKFCQKEKGLVVSCWCLMSNHIHLIIGRNGEYSIESIVRDLKKYTSVHICKAIESNFRETRRDWMLDLFRKAALESSKHQKYKFWQNQYHPIELDTNEMLDQKLEYVHDNPVRAGIVDRQEDYVYSSARDYCTKEKGLIDIRFIE